MNIIELRGIHKAFNASVVLRDVSLSIKKNEFVTILGPSGCGKTTMLRIIGGFEPPTSGELFFGGQAITHLPPHKRSLNTVFQSYALFPHMNIAANVAFGLKIKKHKDAEIEQKLEKALSLVNLSGFESRSVQSLSGGQQQRVAIARALINEPEVLLLDEPLGALDLKLRKDMQAELKNMQKRLGITFVYVTHDQEEALTMSDTIVVMNQGKILQQGSPEDIYNEPVSAFVANFIGSSNILEASMNEDYSVVFEGTSFACVDKKPGEAVEVVVRPEDIEITHAGKGNIEGRVEEVTFFGVHYEMRVKTRHYFWKIHSTAMHPVGSKIGLAIPKEAIHIMRKGEEP